MSDGRAPASARRTKPERLYSLDVLRGVAALAVVFWHWRHFFAPIHPAGIAFDPGRQPFERTLALFYHHGDSAVELFFCLSGFVFFWLYSQAVRSRSISLKEFAWLRLSRLYPLHFATLVIVALGQWAFVARVGAPFVYSNLDLRHLVLQLLFIPAWGLERGLSFNGPVWSVSAEVFAYLVFFAFARWLGRSWLAMAVLVGVGYQARIWNDSLGRGVMGFFIGGLVFLAYDRLRGSRNLRAWALGTGITAATMWAAAFVLTASGTSVQSALLAKLISSSDVALLFPLTVLALALTETWRGSLGRRLAFLGDASYSAYLLHFPLQLAVALLMVHGAIAPATPFAPWFMVAFFVVLLAIALASHRWFEVPMQRAMRRRFRHPQALTHPEPDATVSVSPSSTPSARGR